ncbi:A/G-specific adenine glycosylase [Slackia heliotrinireducens]|uniref:Adenine DNA glycosylase n=1 Tax=Slackia heliotrinireducens (strain ATCC 29202 / DSM 20476 / NCTC 11029 / RHS 1) TaxID=471855 RepID=C7N5Y0_SLAHD|nr:adenine glycosylase [Slackia heliotrinireducens]ACV22315.1 A/G-specific DNA glycosylase [Slackia heliotrinireducens DSM 20476]VEH00534.1 A/G-specific adenine glycosylase [Slackia heliotrinireducens]
MAPTPTTSELHAFVQLVREEGKRLYRDLPWRDTRDPYAIWISEVMLQQTQVPRVLTRWERFMTRFPTVDALSAAASADVLEEWQGMGYNRRALALKRAADICSADFAGALPKTHDELIGLPGIGPSTAAGILAFAYDEPSIYIETNVRAVFIHHFFPESDSVSDKEIRPLVEACCPDSDVRGWYYALLDYGAWLKKEFVNPTRAAKAYTRQSAFEGSRRQKRAWLVRQVMATDGVSSETLLIQLNSHELEEGRDSVDADVFASIMADLQREGFVRLDGDSWRIA